ncbi:MAG: insulinase family protein [Treponema sp.]|jgi:Zn-dependent M16 (insulinase) family peptidase|nr:insulinase family protein [Treponema sp.]
MKSGFNAGDVPGSGVEILDVVAVAELNAEGIWARHRKSGAEVFHVFNDDPENLFAFAFATSPEDSSGAAHILEHLALCGSENYPLKDAFLVLAQGSLQTFLNAWTFPDKTVYPASSVNERDYFNLMSVYGDAVFRPLLSEWAFLQEGHRLEFSPEGDRLSITGVVYNEMKGNYSSPDAYTGLWSVKSVLPGTPYDFESGGDPDHIPELTWEKLKRFHRDRYSPANCRIFLAGNIPPERQFSFLNEKFLAGLPAGRAAAPVSRAEAWRSPRQIRVPCPAGADAKAAVFISWLCSDSADAFETLALGALTETLLGHDGSPLARALVESGLGEDLVPSAGLEADLRETVFTVGLRGVDAPEGIEKRAAQIEGLVLGELARYAREGIPGAEIDAALLGMEFSNREIRRAGGPFSLVWLGRSLHGWLYGAKPWESLLFVPNFTRLKECLARDSRYLESLVRKYLLDNPHRALVIVEPEEGYLEKKEAALAASLAAKEAALSPEERRAIREKSAELARIQSAGEDALALKTIPHLSRKDLGPDIEPVPRELHDLDGVPALSHGLFTNGISYISIAFPVDTLSPEDYFWLPLFSRTVVSAGFPGTDYAAVSSLLAGTAGGFYASLQTGSALPGTAAAVATPSGIFDLAGRDWIIYKLKALDEKTSDSLDLALRLVTEADFSDQRRLRDLVVEMKNDSDSSLAPSGHSYAAARAARIFSRSSAVEEIWGGLAQISFARRIASCDIAEISRALTGIRDRLRAAGVIVNITASPEALPAALSLAAKKIGPFGAPRPRPPASRDAAPFLALGENALARAGTPAPPPEDSAHGRPAQSHAEVFSSPSLQVGFAALSLPGAPLAAREHTAELLLAHHLSTGALWEEIRMKGGAYGAFAHADGVEKRFCCSSYRDPDPLRSSGAFADVLREQARTPVDEETLEKAIIGSYARETRPRAVAGKGDADFLRFLYGIDDSHRQGKLRALIGSAGDELPEAARRLAVAADGKSGGTGLCIIAGPAPAREAAARLGTDVQELPV